MSFNEWISEEGKDILIKIEKLRLKDNILKDEKVRPLSLIDINSLPKLPDNWSWMTSNDISTFITNGVHSPTKPIDELGINKRMLRITDIDEQRNADLKNLPYCNRFTKLDYYKTLKKDDIYIFLLAEIY